MGKRQRSSEYREDGVSSTKSNDETPCSLKQNAQGVCMHVQNVLNYNTIPTNIAASSRDNACSSCVQADIIYNELAKDKEPAIIDGTLWICLKCAILLCGCDKNHHSLQHYTNANEHSLAMNTRTFDVWCYSCNVSFSSFTTPQLQDIVMLFKRESERNGRCSKVVQDGAVKPREESIHVTTESVRKMAIDVLQSPTITSNNISMDVPDAVKLGGSNEMHEEERSSGNVNGPSGTSVGTSASSQSSLSQATRQPVRDNTIMLPNMIEQLPRVRGLANLGNTCFFNAVLQCLARTPYLLPILKESEQEGEKVNIPGGVLKLSDGTETILPAITGELEGWRSLTGALAEILTELNSTETSVISPKRLLRDLASKWPQFEGSDQHDSHELLRHLLESVRTDDLRRYQALILHSLGLVKRKNQQNVDDKQKAMVRFYGDQISQWVFRPEQVFRGSLVSTLTCQECNHMSSRHEYFLDLSLPVCVEKPQPPARRLNSPEPDRSNGLITPVATGASTATVKAPVATNPLSKKEREREKRAKRISKHQKNRINFSSIGGTIESRIIPLPMGGDTSEVTSDGSADMPPVLPLTDDAPDGAVFGNSSDDSHAPSDADAEDNDCTDELLLSKAGDSAAPLKVDQNGNKPQFGSALLEKTGDAQENLDKENAGNIVCEVGISAHRAAHMSKQLLGNFIATGTDTEDELSRRRAGESLSRVRQRTYSHADWSNTIAPRYQCEDGEYSVQSCLNNFTAVEFMTDNNKVCCEACTERVNGKDGKSVNTNATKQFLISVPPAVLILHLKRFQVGPRGIFKKIMKPVSFPFVLDIAPFCGSKVKRASHIRPGQKKILYALYGVVEHSGSMHGGHYVAYVKVRAPFGSTDLRWKFIPQGTKDELDRKSEQEMAKEQALRMGVHVHDSDDSLSSTHSDDESDGVYGPVCNNLPQQQDLRQDRQQPQEEEEEEEGAVGYRPKTVGPPAGKWYCVSDNYVREVTEENVLNVQAYLLFYERIF